MSDRISHNQGWSLFLSTGVDCRKCNLSKDEANQLIETSLKDPKSAQEILLSKGGELKNPKNLQAALRRIEKFGVSFKLKEKSMEIIRNHKTNKKIRRKINNRISEIIQEIGSKYSQDQPMFEKIADILNKEGYRCCDGGEWQYKSVYDFHRRITKKPARRKSISVSMNQIKNVNDSTVDKESLLKTIMDSDMDSSAKLEIIRKVYL